MCREPLHLASERSRLPGTLERHERFGDGESVRATGVWRVLGREHDHQLAGWRIMPPAVVGSPRLNRMVFVTPFKPTTCVGVRHPNPSRGDV
jgi:hypothetical protein